MELKEQPLHDACERTLKLAKKKGATSAEVHIATESGFSVTSRLGEIETLQHHRDRGLGVTVYFGKKSGFASSSDIDASAILQVVNKACAIAKFTDDDPYTGLAEKEFLAKTIPNLDLYHPWNIQPDEGLDIAKECEQIALASDKRITNSEGATFSSYENYGVYANSLGFISGYHRTSHNLDCTLIAQTGNTMQRDYYYTCARDYHDLLTPKVVAKHAVENTVRRLGTKPIKTQQAPVIFKAELARGLIRCLTQVIQGSNIYRDASFLVDHLGKQIFPNKIKIYQRPHIKKGMGSKPYDSEGVATADRAIINDGVLQTYILNSYSARKLDLKTTGNAGGIQNILIDTDNLTFDELLKEMGRGLLVTELIGQGINIVTGDYSRGAFGYWVENGEIQHPVEGITIAGNLRDMFKGIVAVADDIDNRGVVRSGSILIDKMSIAAG